jgi:hypothetical protein
MSFRPRTRLGGQALGLVVVSVAFFVATVLMATLGGQGGTGWPALTLVPAGLAGLGGAIAAMVAVVREHERGIVTLIPFVVGAAIALIVIVEVATPV